MWNEKILVADGDPGTRNLFYEILFSLNYEVSCVPSGQEVLVRLTDERFDLILLDENLPGLSGIEIAAKVREFDKEVKIIILSKAAPSQPLEEAAGKLKIRAVLKKDFSDHFMMKKILEVLKEETAVLTVSVTDKPRGIILVVDDNQEIRNVLQEFLGKRGYKVLTSSCGLDAVMKVKTENPQLVFLDMRMPGMDGLLVLRQLKQLNESLKIVMLTSVQDEYVMAEAQKEGACDYIIKPCDLQKLGILVTALFIAGQKKII